MKLKFKDIFKIESCSFEFIGPDSILQQPIQGVSIDSRTINPNELYFALIGENHDGHNFVEEVYQKQAIAAIVEKKWWQQNQHKLQNKTVLVVEDSLRALQELANFYRKQFTIPVIALTGTNGKTTTKEMIAAVLYKAGSVCKTQGNYNNHIGVPLTLFQLDNHHQYLVVEMGTNHFGEIARLCEIAAPQYGLITNIGHGHTEFLRDIKGVTRAKMELFKHLHKTGGVIFANTDDENITRKIKAFNSIKTYGFRGKPDIHAEDLGLNENGCAVLKVEETTIALNVAGKHNMSNALAAIAVAKEFGIKINDIKSALESIHLPSKRMEIIKHNNITILNDSYNANPESMLAALHTLSGVQVPGKKYFVMGDMLELGDMAAKHHAKIGKSLRGFGIDTFFAYGPYSEEAIKHTPAGVTAQHFTDKTDLAKSLKNKLLSGDLILIKGSRSMKMEDVLDKILKG